MTLLLLTTSSAALSLPLRTASFSRATLLTVDPKFEQCACEIHTQMVLYLQAMDKAMKLVHDEDCECGGCDRWLSMFKNLGSFSDSLACAKVDLLAGDPEKRVEFFGQKPECSSMTCDRCGFNGPDGIPASCPVIARNKDRIVEWVVFGTYTHPDRKVKKDQQLPKTGTLGEL